MMKILGWTAFVVLAIAVVAGEEAKPEAGESKAPDVREAAAPAGFKWQVMEPTGGKILMPEGWHYREGHRDTAWMWTISKEDSNGAYETGMRIQAFMGIGEKTGATAGKFVKGILEQHKKSADEIHKTCEATKQELFTRQCLEVTEGDFRIMYSCFWNNEMDLAVISIAGTKKGDWEKYAKTFDTMGTFELIDMSRFSEDEEKKEE